MSEHAQNRRKQMLLAALIVAVVALGLIAINPLLAWLGVFSLLLIFFAPPSDKGPTAIPALILAILAISVGFTYFLVTEAVPGIIEGGRRAAGKTAVSTLRTLYWGQNLFRQQALVDQNGNGVGEFGFFGEMTGVAPLRGSQERSPAGILRPRFFKLAEGALAGIAINGPYCYVIYLPGEGGPLIEDAQGKVGENGASAELQESHWIAYAWPLEVGATSDKVYFINQFEEIFESDNLAAAQKYTGPNHMPAWDAAPLKAGLTGKIEEGLGGDGGTWKRWKGKTAKPLPKVTPKGQ